MNNISERFIIQSVFLEEYRYQPVFCVIYLHDIFVLFGVFFITLKHISYPAIKTKNVSDMS